MLDYFSLTAHKKVFDLCVMRTVGGYKCMAFVLNVILFLFCAYFVLNE